MSEWTLYLDESGNTGTNVLDTNQLFYVYAGWLVRNSEDSKSIEYIRKSFRRVRASELKSVNILDRYRPQIYTFLQNALKNGLYPFYYVFEKRFYICCKIVETFFDYAHNSNVPKELTFDFEKKKEICNAIYKNEELLKLFSCLLVDSTIDIKKMNQIKNLLARSLNTSETIAYKEMVSNATNEELYSMINEFECLSKEHKIRQSPGGTELFALINEVENLMRINGETATIVADELKNKTFINDIKEIIDNRSQFSHVVDLQVGVSKENILLQAADLLSGYIHAIYKKDSRINNEETNKIIFILNTYNEKMLEAGICPLNCSLFIE